MQVLLVAAKKDMVLSFGGSDSRGRAPAPHRRRRLVRGAERARGQLRLRPRRGGGEPRTSAPRSRTSTSRAAASRTSRRIFSSAAPRSSRPAQRKFNISQAEAEAVVRGESTSGIDVTPVIEQSCEALAPRARARSGLPAHGGRGGRRHAHHAVRRQRPDAGSHGLPAFDGSAFRPRSRIR